MTRPGARSATRRASALASVTAAALTALTLATTADPSSAQASAQVSAHASAHVSAHASAPTRTEGARATTTPVRARPAAPHLRVDLARGHHRISPLIYGVNFASQRQARQLRLTVDRWGGNTTETYNWQIHGANHGSDYYFEDLADCWDDAHHYCADPGSQDYSAVDAQLRQDQATHTASLVTLPEMGWVARDVSGDHGGAGAHLCSFPAATYDPQDDHDPFDASCGNGQRGGQDLTADPTRAGVAVGADFDAAWVRSLVAHYGAARHGGVGLYELGNEPALWDQTHRDLHPQPTTYDELWAKSRDLATAVKTADPGARTLGPAEWGWPNYFCSAADDVDQGCSASSPDRAAHGGTALVPWLLEQFAAAQQQTGTRLLDYLDLHYYPQGTYSPVTDVTRSLWDPTYTDPSWIADTIDLLPRMRDWVAQAYPGTKTSLSEYNLGLDVTPSRRLQNVIEADALGIFGREGLDLATFWPEDRSPVPAAAFGMFRDYDGHGHGFGDRGVEATSSDQTRLAVYAARDGRRGPLTVVVVNKTGHRLRTAVRLAHAHLRGAHPVQAWRYAGHRIGRAHGVHATRGAVTATFPAASITLLRVAVR